MKKTKYYAVHFSGNWADEIDLEALIICSADTVKYYEQLIEALENYIEENDEYSCCIGSNEDLILKDASEVSDMIWIDSLDIDNTTYKKLDNAGCTEIDPQGIFDNLFEDLLPDEDDEDYEDEDDE